jgi:hypothetical protein
MIIRTIPKCIYRIRNGRISKAIAILDQCQRFCNLHDGGNSSNKLDGASYTGDWYMQRLEPKHIAHDVDISLKLMKSKGMAERRYFTTFAMLQNC